MEPIEFENCGNIDYVQFGSIDDPVQDHLEISNRT